MDPPPDRPRPQPDPLKASVSHLRVGHRCFTAIYREWPPGTVGPRGACRRCPECTAEADACHLHAPRFVAAEDAPGFALPE